VGNSTTKFQYVIYILFAITIGLSFFLYSQLLKEKELRSESNTKIEEKKCEREICTYGRYGIEYTSEEIASFETMVYRHITEVKDAVGNSVGYNDLTLRLKDIDKTYILEMVNDVGNGFYIDGTYTVAEDETEIVLIIDEDKNFLPDDLQFPSDLRFSYENQGSSLVYEGGSITNYTLKKGDIYHSYWAE